MNHAEPELLLKAGNEMEVRIREANGRRLKFVVLHDSKSLQTDGVVSLPKSIEEPQRQLNDI